MGKFTDGKPLPAMPANGMKGLSVPDSIVDIDGDEFIQSQAWSDDVHEGEGMALYSIDESGYADESGE